METESMETIPDDFLRFRWGWKCEWYGWRRMLWFAVAIDFRLWCAYVVLFGLGLSYGKQLVEVNYSTATIGNAKEVRGEN